MGAKLICHGGFHARNTLIADSQNLIAFSWSDGDCPTSGGTLDTWTKSTAEYKIHLPLNSLKANDNDALPATKKRHSTPIASKRKSVRQ